MTEYHLHVRRAKIYDDESPTTIVGILGAEV